MTEKGNVKRRAKTQENHLPVDRLFQSLEIEEEETVEGTQKSVNVVGKLVVSNSEGSGLIKSR